MKLYNFKNQSEQVSFVQAVKQGLGQQQGFFFPLNVPTLNDEQLARWLQCDFIIRSSYLLSAYIGDEMPLEQVTECVKQAFNFPLVVRPIIEENIASLELHHGPTLAFKDFGGRFMAQILAQIASNQPITILTATSGDTGAAVAHAFYRLKNVQVIILYPENKITPLQAKLFCTLGENIHPIAIKGDFDDCQRLVKQAFDDEELKRLLCLTSANSINISRLLAQICYYFEAVAQLAVENRQQLVISVPSGNFGNLTAGLFAKAMGLPVKRFIAATNVNDTVPRYLSEGKWLPNQTIATLSNTKDVSQPNNWPRIETLFLRQKWELDELSHGVVDDRMTEKTVQQLASKGYISEPHSAVAYRILRDQLQDDEYGLFLSTAHPAKFKQSVDRIFAKTLPLPAASAKRANLPIFAHQLSADFALLRNFLFMHAT
ncbi:threonine synthase [Arsenophonus endosymbiont of Bemisia tabaci Asia II 3]|nr:threonine synthase [Arsenophonus endosymbiont of Bemisia tabaci Asia II 3]